MMSLHTRQSLISCVRNTRFAFLLMNGKFADLIMKT